MKGPIETVAASPEMAELLDRLGAIMPKDTAIFIVAIGPRTGADGMREVALGGPLEDRRAMEAASTALALRSEPAGGITLKARMH